MAQVDLTNPVVTEQSSSGFTVSAPAGEIWEFRLKITSVGGPGDANMNNVVFQENQKSPNTLKSVMADGDTLDVANLAVYDGAAFAAYKVNTGDTVDIDNAYVSEQVSGGGSVTVPTGETWDVTILATVAAGSPGALKINGHNISENNKPDNIDMILTEGDTVSVQGTSNSGCHIGGYKV